MGSFGTLKLGGQFVILSGLMHFVAAAFGDTMIMATLGVLYILIGMGLTRGMRWLGYFAFLFMIFGSMLAYGFMTVAPAPQWVTMSIIALDLLAAVNLFIAIWKAPAPKVQAS